MMRHVPRYRIDTPAKVNLTLDVLGRREDGFHELRSLFVPVGIFDRLEVEVGGSGIHLSVPDEPSLEGDENLCARAARAFASRTGLPGDCTILLRKEIPFAAGLGGGSSDAAAILRILAHAHGLPAQDERVRAAALDVGSDVPFFLLGEPALATGRGEILQPPPALPPLFLTLVKPAWGVSAKEAYERLASLRRSGDLPPGASPELPPVFADASEVAACLRNDLEDAVATFRPVRELRRRLIEAGALGAAMSGSGSVVFGLHRSYEDALECRKSFRPAPDERVFVAATLADSPPLHETP